MDKLGFVSVFNEDVENLKVVKNKMDLSDLKHLRRSIGVFLRETESAIEVLDEIILVNETKEVL